MPGEAFYHRPRICIFYWEGLQAATAASSQQSLYQNKRIYYDGVGVVWRGTQRLIILVLEIKHRCGWRYTVKILQLVPTPLESALPIDHPSKYINIYIDISIFVCENLHVWSEVLGERCACWSISAVSRHLHICPVYICRWRVLSQIRIAINNW